MKRVILAVDDPNRAQDIQNRLRQIRYDVIATTATADEVISRADELQPDIILMDVRLKGGADGIEAAKQIKRLQDIPIIFITADTNEATVRRAIAAEPDGFLTTPLDGLELIAVIDVATRKYQKERQAQVTDTRLRELTDALPVVVYETDATGRITFANATSSTMFGYTKEEVEAGMSIFQLIVPADRERANAVFNRRMSGEDVGQVGYTGLRKDGSTFYTSIRAVLMRQDAAVVGMRGVIVDITERKRAEEALAWESAINSSVARLYAPLIAPTSTIEDTALAILDEAKLLVGSKHGFVGFIDPVNRDLITFGVTRMSSDECAIPEEKRQIRFPISPDGSYSSLWGYALNTKEGFYTNAPSTHPASRGTPDGHNLPAQLLAAPVLIGDKVWGIIELADPGRDYTERDLMAVERLADVYALAIVRTQEEETVRITLKEKETLLKEIHHRVKNNMQIVSSLLSLQAGKAAQPETVSMLKESQRQIRSMALIHEKLYRSGSLAEIDFGDYVESLVNELRRMFHVAEGVITIITDIENVMFNVDTAIPCGLIVNELVTNVFKYAFPDGRTGEATIALHRINGTYTLTVADNGVGLPSDLDVQETDTLGLQLVNALVNQLDGTISLDRSKGTTFIITLKPQGETLKRVEENDYSSHRR